MENDLWAWLDQLNQWHWFILGLILLIGEAFGAAGFLLGAAFGALITGVLVSISPAIVDGGMLWRSQVLTDAALSIVCSLLYWRYFRADLQDSDRPELNHKTSQYIGRKLTLKTDIDFEGRIQIGDTFWKVKSDDTLKEGDKVEVIDSDTNTLFIKKIG